MNKQIQLKDLKKYSKEYNKNKDLKLESKLKNENLRKVCLNKEVYDENKFEFNFDLGDSKISCQYSTKLCWLYAVLNFLKLNVADNLQIERKNFLLSYSYLAFFDKLEKSNYLYQSIIDLPKDNYLTFSDFYNSRILIDFLEEPFRENGSALFAFHLIKKYGLIPFDAMPETISFKQPDDCLKIYIQKLRYDVYKIIKAKSKNKDLYSLKDKMLKENYKILSMLFGEPPQNFNYVYKNKDKKIVKLLNTTPVDFYNKYCNINLDDYLLCGNSSMPNKCFYKTYQRYYYGNIYGSNYKFLNLPFKDLKNLIIKQLKSREPVVFSTENKKYRDLNSTVLDKRLFNYEKIFGIKDLPRKQSQESMDISSKHWMVFKGFHMEKEQIIRWKVEDSRGITENSNGYYVMNDNFFNHCVFFALINKKHLTKEQILLSQQKPIFYSKRNVK